MESQSVGMEGLAIHPLHTIFQNRIMECPRSTLSPIQGVSTKLGDQWRRDAPGFDESDRFEEKISRSVQLLNAQLSSTA